MIPTFRARRSLLLVALAGGLTGCGLFGGSDNATPEQAAATAEAQSDPTQAQGPGVLATITQRAPPGSSVQLLARLAAEFGWEAQVAQDPLLQETTKRGRWEDRVEPQLLGLFYKNGFTVLPVVGEGHQVARDTIVRGAVGSARLLVTNRDPVRIIFLRPVGNVQIVYHQDGTEPQVFTVGDRSVVAVRQSLLKQYLR